MLPLDPAGSTVPPNPSLGIGVASRRGEARLLSVKSLPRLQSAAIHTQSARPIRRQATLEPPTLQDRDVSAHTNYQGMMIGCTVKGLFSCPGVPTEKAAPTPTIS